LDDSQSLDVTDVRNRKAGIGPGPKHWVTLQRRPGLIAGLKNDALRGGNRNAEECARVVLTGRNDSLAG